MEKARSNGGLKTEKDYVNLAKLYLITGQNWDDPKPNATKAMRVLEDGISKGVGRLQLRQLKLLGDSAYIAGDDSKAIDSVQEGHAAWQRMAKRRIRAGQLLLSQHKYSEAKTLIQQGIDKGVQHKGTAYMLLAEAERGLKNKPGAIAAMKNAAQDPDTAAKAKAWLKQADAGK